MSVILSVEGILRDLANGLTRTTSDKHYNEEVGSLTEKYSLTNSEIATLFKEPRLKGARVTPKKKVSWTLVDTEAEVEQLSGDIEESSSDMEASVPTQQDESVQEELTEAVSEVQEEPLF